MQVRTSLLLALLATASPLASGFAQQTVGSGLKADSTKEADQVKSGSASNAQQPGATGSTIVPGNNSTVAGDQKATDAKKSGGGGGGGK